MSMSKNPVLVAIDFSADSESALCWSADYARMASADLHVVHVIHEPAEEPGFYTRNKDEISLTINDLANRQFEQFLKDVKSRHSDLPALNDLTPIATEGIPADRIVAVAQKIDAGLVVVGCRGHGPLSRFLLGSVAHRVIEMSPIPVMVIKSQYKEPHD